MLALLLALAGCAHHPGGSPATDPAAVAALPGGAPAIAGVPAPLLGGPLADVPPVSPEEVEAKQLYLSARDRIDALDFEGAQARLAELVARYPTTEAAVTGAKLAAQIAIVGQQAPPLDVATWLQGEGAIPAEGTVLLLFFESWCPHCVREAAHVATIQGAWGPRGLQVVALTRLTRSATAAQAMELAATSGWTFPVGVEREGAVAAAYGVSGVPQAAVIVDGKVAWRGHPARLDDGLLTALVK